MSRRWQAFAWLLLTTAGACSIYGSAPPAFVSFETGAKDVAHLLSNAADPVPALEEMRSARGLPLSFWAEDVPDEASAFVQEHPCGKTLTVLASQMPHSSFAYLVGERVLEIDGKGQELRRWMVPVDSIVRRIDGDALLVTKSYATQGDEIAIIGLSIRSDGTFRVIQPPPDVPPQIDCPPLPAFGRSNYLRCWKVTDGEGKQRQIAYQSPCT